MLIGCFQVLIFFFPCPKCYDCQSLIQPISIKCFFPPHHQPGSKFHCCHPLCRLLFLPSLDRNVLKIQILYSLQFYPYRLIQFFKICIVHLVRFTTFRDAKCGISVFSQPSQYFKNPQEDSNTVFQLFSIGLISGTLFPQCSQVLTSLCYSLPAEISDCFNPLDAHYPHNVPFIPNATNLHTTYTIFPLLPVLRKRDT